jgi:aldose 1-epimerase
MRRGPSVPSFFMDSPATVIELRAGRARAGIAPAIGGSLAYFRWSAAGEQHDWLRPATADDLRAGTADRLACFPLVPFSNRIRDGRFGFRRHAVQLPLNQWPQPHAEHGHGWQAAWQVVARADDGLTLEYDHSAGAWPFPYRARQTIELTADKLSLTLAIENRGPEAMPAGLGFHPYFPRTNDCRLAAPVAAMWETDSEVMPTTLVPPDPRLGRSEGLPVACVPLDNAFTGWARAATILWPERGARLLLTASPPLGFLVVYTPPGEPYFCAEPVSHCTDAFNLAAQGRGDTGMLVVEPGRGVSATVRLRPSLA